MLQRLRGVGAVDEQTLLDLGVTGPLLRAAGNPWDLRKADAVLELRPLRLQDPGRHRSATTTTATACAWPRCASRCKIIEQALDGLPEGPYITDDRKYALPPRHELATSMEALIHHFKLVTEGFRVPPGEAYYPIESPRGELGCFVRSDGSSKPARVHMRDPSFVNLQAFAPMVQGPLHRRPDRDAGDARPDPRADRPLMAIDPAGQALRARLARPGLGRRRPTSTKDPAVVPDPATTPVPDDAARADRGADGQVPGPPLGARSRR